MDSTSVSGVNNNMKDGVATEKEQMSGEAEKRMNRVYRRMFLFLLLDLIAFTIILPLLPSLLTFYGQKDQSGLYAFLRYISSKFRTFLGIEDANADTVLLGGIVSSLFSFLQFLSSPIIGAASDIYGRRPMMLLCMVGVALSYVLWMMSHSFLLFVVARFVGGISKGNVNLSMSIVTDVSNKEKRGKGMAYIGIAFSLGFIIGPALGAYFTSKVREKDKGIYYLYPGLFAFAVALLDILLMYLFLEETLPSYKRVQDKSYIRENARNFISPSSIFSFRPVQKLGGESRASVKRLGLIYFLYMFIYSGLEFTLPFLMTLRYGYSSMAQGKMFFFIGLVMILIQGAYTRRIKVGRHKAASIRGMRLLIPAFLIFALTEVEPINILALPLFAFASATVVPSLTTLVSVYGGDDQKGIILGIFRSLGALARATGPIFFSTIFWLFGENWCYGIGALALVIPLYLFRAPLKEKD